MKNRTGHALMEFLMATAVVAAIGMVVVAILSSTLRGTKKTDIISSIRINGNQAIVQMTRLTKFAKEFEGVSKDGSPNSYSLSCVVEKVMVPTPTPTPILYKYLKFIAEDGGEIIFSCDEGNKTIASNSASLIDTNVVEVLPNKCWFTCIQNRVSNTPIVRVYFELKQAGTATFAESQFFIPFETSFLLKNLAK